ncbi:MAG: MerR family transcriptional regulator [Planctomycetes bacterium]|nr:MerR family transcriptional regulator [Planctomycetota bacterium]
MRLYKAQDVKQVCRGVTLRMLDYWVESGVIKPTMFLETNRRKRTIYLFSFQDLVRIQFVKSLRDSGISLQRIRSAISLLKGRRGKIWQADWLISDGKNLFSPTDDPRAVELLVKGETGQLAFSIVAFGPIQQLVKKRLTECQPVDISRFDAEIKKWEEHQIYA